MRTSTLTKWSLLGLPLIAVLTVAAMNQQAQTVAWVNTALILRQTPGYAQAESTFAAEVQSYQAEVKNLQAELDSAISNLEQQSVVLSPTARQEKQRELAQQQRRLEQRIQELQTKSQQRERELMAPLEERIQSVIEGIRAERNIAIIFDAASGGTIVAADRALDLTASVVQRLTAGKQ